MTFLRKYYNEFSNVRIFHINKTIKSYFRLNRLNQATQYAINRLLQTI